MKDTLSTSLIVSGIGMLMLFLAMVLLYGLMYGMTALLRDRESAESAGSTAGSVPQRAENGKQKAAAIALALARAELEAHPLVPSEGRTESSPWRQYHHHRSLSHPGERGTSQ